MRYILLMVVGLAVASCQVSRPFTALQYNDRALADSMLAYALDHEAVYTLLDTIKPISSVKFLRFPVAKTSLMKDGDHRVTPPDSLPELALKYARICAELSKGDHQFVMMPFAQNEGHMRSIEIYVVRKSRFSSLIAQHAAFFGQWGFTPESDPATVLPVIEYESRHDRNRGYGLLFGYPLYAVDFFVAANQAAEKDTTIKLVPRDFFAIPVYAGNKGYFTYAMPKEHKPLEIDSVIYRKAVHTLDRYKAQRSKYITPGGLKATALWSNWNKKP